MEYQPYDTFETQIFRIKTRFNVVHYLVPFGDVHRYSPLCSESHWKEFLDKARKRENLWLYGMGDYTDLLSASERRLLRHEDAHESTAETLENFYEDLVEKFAEELMPFRGRIIGLHEGNHQIKFLDGSTSTQRLCRKLGCKYLGNVAFVKILFEDARNSRTSLTIFSHHGIGNARTTAGGFRMPEAAESIAEADIYLMGHNHQKGVLAASRLYLHQSSGGTLKVRHRKILFVRTGSYLRAFVEGKKSYAAARCYRPTDLGSPFIDVMPYRRQENGAEEYGIDLYEQA